MQVMFMIITLIFFLADPAILNFFQDPELLRFGAFLVFQVSKMLTKNFFFLKEKIIDKTIKLSIYIKNLLHENTTISFVHLVDAQEIS